MQNKQLTYVFALILLSFGGCNSSTKVKSIKLGHGLDVNHTVHKAMELMADRLAELSDDQLIIKIYPNQQLGTERQLVELLQIGSVGMTKVSSGVLENFAPGMKVLGLPFIFNNRQHHFDVLDSEIGKNLLAEGEKYWLKGLAYYDAGARSFYTKSKPIDYADDLAGLKIRVMSSVTAVNMVNAFGGSPTPIAWGEVYTSLQQGIVDGAENNPPSFYLSRHYEVCKYYSLDEHTFLPDVLLISTVVWDRLTDQEQKWIQQAADESVVYQRKIWKEAEDLAIKEVIKAGVLVSYPDKSSFQASVYGIYEEYSDDEHMVTLIKEIQQFSESKN
jgi:tripartite ATP-independent transporter DctP family solute receptor